MANEEHLAVLQDGVESWNRWRHSHKDLTPDLSRSDLRSADLEMARLDDTNLRYADLRGCSLYKASLCGADVRDADLRDARLSFADLRGAYLNNANLSCANLVGADLSHAVLLSADFHKGYLVGTNFSDADVRGANFEMTNLDSARFESADLSGSSFAGSLVSRASLIDTKLAGTNFDGCCVYGISVWDVDLDDQTSQRDLIITPIRYWEEELSAYRIVPSSYWAPAEDPPYQEYLQKWGASQVITVDDLEVAQFIYLLLENKRIRTIIDTISSKVVLILGRFSEERKTVLDAMRDALRRHGFASVLFDFDKPASRDLTETVSTLAHMARFVIADITDAKGIPQELQKIVPNLPSLPIRPIIMEGQYEYAMFKDFGGYLSVLAPYRYRDTAHLLDVLDQEVIAPALARAEEIERRRKAFEMGLAQR